MNYMYDKEDLKFFALYANQTENTKRDIQLDKKYFIVGVLNKSKTMVQDAVTNKVYGIKNINGNYFACVGSRAFKQIDIVAEQNTYKDFGCVSCKIDFLDAENTIVQKHIAGGNVYDVYPLDSNKTGVYGFNNLYNYLLEDDTTISGKKLDEVVAELNKTMHKIVKYEVAEFKVKNNLDM